MNPRDTIATRSARKRRQNSCSGDLAVISPPGDSSMLKGAAASSASNSDVPMLMSYPVLDATPQVLLQPTPSRWNTTTQSSCHIVLTRAQRSSCPDRRSLGDARATAGYPQTAAALVAQWIEHAPPKRGMQVRFLPGALPVDARRVGRTPARRPSVPCGHGEARYQKHLAARVRHGLSVRSRASVRASSSPRPRRRMFEPRPRPGGVSAAAETLVANPTLEQHPAPQPARATRDDRRLGDLIRRRPEPLIAIAVLVLATLFVVWARTRPGLRPLRLAGVGPPDAHRGARHQRGAVVEAAAVPVHAALRAVRPLPAVAVDDHLGRDLAQRRRVRRPDRLPS